MLNTIPQYIPEQEFPIQIAPGVQVLGNYFFNLFLIRGKEKTALFEVGISGVVDQVIDQLDRLGVSPDYLILSHPHSDHITGLPGLMERFPKAQVLAAQGAEGFVSHPKAGPALIKEDRFMSQSLEEQGIIPGRPSLETVPVLKDHTVIGQTAGLDLGGGMELTLIPVQGHSPGNLLAWIPSEKILFCSDSLGFHYPGRGFWPLFFTGASPYIKTMEMMEALSPRIICPAHQGPIKGKDVPIALKGSLAVTREIIQRIQDTGQDDDALAAALFEESYRDEFTLYTQTNIQNCSRLLIKRARES